MPTVTEIQPRTSGSTRYIVCDVQGRQCLAPESQPTNLSFTFLVKLDPKSGQEFYVSVKTKAKSWDLPDVDAAGAVTPQKGDSEIISHAATLECAGTVYELLQSDGGAQYVPQGLPFEPAPVHCWRPFYDAAKKRFLYENCATNERVPRLPPILDYCDAVRQLYDRHGIEGDYVDALRCRFGDERRLIEELSIQYGPKPIPNREAFEVAECYFNKYDTSMLKEMGNLLEQWRGNEIEFLEALQKEYGKRPRTTRERVRAIYAQYNPAKMFQCDEQVDQYKGQDDELLTALQRKFGPEMIKEDDLLEDIAHRVRCQFLRYDADRVATVEDVLAKHKGAEVQLLELLICHYGPEVDVEEREKQLKAPEPAVGGATNEESNKNIIQGDVDASTLVALVATETVAQSDTRIRNTKEDHQDVRDGESSKNGTVPPELAAEEHEPAVPVTPPMEQVSNASNASGELSAVAAANKIPETTTDGDDVSEKPVSTSTFPQETVVATATTTAAAAAATEVVVVVPAVSAPVSESQTKTSPSLPSQPPSVEVEWPSRAELLETERKLREEEFQRQQERIALEEERLARELTAHRRFVALETERHWKEESEKVVEIARVAAQQAVQEAARLQRLRDEENEDKERLGDVVRQEAERHAIGAVNSASAALVAQFAHMKTQLGDAFTTVEGYAQRNEKLQSDKTRLLNKFAEMQHQYDLELQGMRIHLDDMRVRIATMKNEHDVKTLHLKKQEEITILGMSRELERERDAAVKERVRHEETEAAMEVTIAGLQRQLQTVLDERDAAQARLTSHDAVLRERTAELEGLYAVMQRQRTARKEAASQTDVEEGYDVGSEPHPALKTANALCNVVSSSEHHCQCVGLTEEVLQLQRVCEESQQYVADLCAEKERLTSECERARCVIGVLQRKVETLETTVERLELRQLAVPDIPVCAGEKDIVLLNLKEDLNKTNSSLIEAKTESTMLKREIRELRSLLAIYMSNARKP
ncbi:hypothetical protein DQ04_06481030 [Trypanosoma grayi]|uniref:hypothetical protein n=1 Tax=Trypanosoma grayi TaxID=71804 RepID=UPI0004F432BD|nr:hypothetical protein DQ04_06481030 [Trypanosoma grayi]KEG08769.1 hypothetical protein DQ04_06481030 [Trypanosoma grayi]